MTASVGGPQREGPATGMHGTQRTCLPRGRAGPGWTHPGRTGWGPSEEASSRPELSLLQLCCVGARVHVCVRTHVYLCTHITVHVIIHTYIYTIHMCTCRFVNTRVNTCMCWCVHMCMHTPVYVYVYPCACVFVCARICACVWAHAFAGRQEEVELSLVL